MQILFLTAALGGPKKYQ